MAAEDPAASPPPALEGVTLEQYAGITVALAEGFPLDAALASEGLPAAAWPKAEVAWKARLARDGARGPVFAAFSEKRAFAEDWLARRVEPLDDDLDAWVSFLHAWGAHPAPFELLAGSGLGVNDVARLTRAWARRLESDRTLQKQAAKLAQKPAGPLPAIRVEPDAPGGERLLRKPFPWSKGRAAKPAAAPAPPGPPAVPGALSVLDLSFYRYIAAKAHLAEHPDGEEDVRQKFMIADFPAVDAAWQARLRGDAALAQDFRRLLDHERGRLRAAAQKAHQAPESEAPAVSTAPTGAAVLAGTALTLDIPRGPALPFAPAPEKAPAPPSNDLAGTALTLDIPRGPALPFAPVDRSPLTGTARSLDIPRGPAMPFVTRAAGLGDTVLDLDMAAILAAAGLKVEPPPLPPPPPDLTLEQHASLSCELREAPERAPQTLARYQLTPAEKAALDERFEERFAEDPAQREAWEHAYQTYRAWWLEHGKQ